MGSGPLDGGTIASRSAESVSCLRKAPPRFRAFFIAQPVMRHVGCENLEVADDRVRLARDEVAEEAAVVRAQTQERLLDEVIQDRRRVNVPAAGGPKDGKCNRTLESADELSPCGFAPRFAADAGEFIRRYRTQLHISRKDASILSRREPSVSKKLVNG